MLTNEQAVGIYICIPVYFAMLGLAAYWAHKRMERMVNTNVADNLQAHFLGGR